MTEEDAIVLLTEYIQLHEGLNEADAEMRATDAVRIIFCDEARGS